MSEFDPKAFLKTVGQGPGVYRMLNGAGDVLYVGKARNLRKRLASYFRTQVVSARTVAMLRQVGNIEVTVTHTETEALLLENNLIKTLKPRYNVLLRDDKSYPYIYLSEGEPFPRLGFHRGAKHARGRYFGPYPSAQAVRESLQLLQKVFPIRQCEDSYFRNRSRPCLQHQIKRCTAPCVGLIDEQAYAEDVRHAALFLEGRNDTVTQEMMRRMELAAARQDYELAALYRDRIAALRLVQERQYIEGEGGDTDLIACALESGEACVFVTFVRGGRHVGSKTFFPRAPLDATPSDILAAFLPQYYLDRPTPRQVYVSHRFEGQEALAEALCQQLERRIDIVTPSRGARRQWIGRALVNAQDSLRRHLAGQANMLQRLEALQAALGLDALPERLECFDVSHTMGEATVASCVVFDKEGPLKSAYRRFNIEGVAAGDDYGALGQALTRRYKRVQEGEVQGPDVLFIDGGKGQLGVATQVLSDLQVQGLALVAIAKGPERKPGQEVLFLSAREEATILPPDSPALHLIQQIRDEAHRFAITGHRQRRGKARVTSSLEEIPGIGQKKRQALLKNFGGLQALARAGVEELMRVPGISPDLARRIYAAFHDERA